MRIGPTELALVLAIVLIVFGAGRLPQVFSQMGRGIKAFRDAQRDDAPDDELDVTKGDKAKDDKPKQLEVDVVEVKPTKELERTI